MHPLRSRHIIANYEVLRADPRRPKGGPRPNRVPVQHNAEFILGCDLAQANDYTALCLVQRGATGCKIRWLSRTRGKTYPQIVRGLSWLVQRPELENRTQLVVDATGVGRAVTDMLHSAGLNPVRITITSGSKAVGTRGAYKVPKQDLISSLIIALQTDRLKIAAAIKYADELRHELEEFRMFSSEAGHASYGAAAGHDDLVISLALAVWYAGRGRFFAFTSTRSPGNSFASSPSIPTL